MTQIGVPLDTDRREAAAREMQTLLCDFIALGLNAKQAHWHVTGRHFTPIHEQLDAIVADARAWSDTAAERSVTLGVPVDGRPAAVAANTQLGDFPEGFLADDKVVEAIVREMTLLLGRLRAAIDRLGDVDLVSQSFVIDVTGTLEKHIWMLQAQLD